MLWVSILAIFFLLLDFLNPNVSGNLVELGTLGSWVFYILSFVAVIILRKTQPNLNRPYKVPLYPIIPILAILGGLFASLRRCFRRCSFL
jgi:APA family basic amino acid/polyamine antiporter